MKERFNFNNKTYNYKRGQILMVDLGDRAEVRGSEQCGLRPCVVVQNDTGNKFAPTLIIAPVTSQRGKHRIPTHIELNSEKYYLDNNSTILAEQVKVIDKTRVIHYIGELDSRDIARMNKGIMISMGLAS